jgi:uncharacterized membrane protein
MVWAARRRLRALWLTGARCCGRRRQKLFVVDLAALSGLPRIAAFLGVGVMLLAISYFAPPPSSRPDACGAARMRPAGPGSRDQRGDGDAATLTEHEVRERRN